MSPEPQNIDPREERADIPETRSEAMETRVAPRVESVDQAIDVASSIAQTTEKEISAGRARAEQYAAQSGEEAPDEEAEALAVLETGPRRLLRKLASAFRKRPGAAIDMEADPPWTSTGRYETGPQSVAADSPEIYASPYGMAQVADAEVDRAFFQSSPGTYEGITEEELRTAERPVIDRATRAYMEGVKRIARDVEARQALIEQLITAKDVDGLSRLAIAIGSAFEVMLQETASQVTRPEDRKVFRQHLGRGRLRTDIARQKPVGLDLIALDLKRVREEIGRLEQKKSEAQETQDEMTKETVVMSPEETEALRQQTQKEGGRFPDIIELEESAESRFPETIELEGEGRFPGAIELDEPKAETTETTLATESQEVRTGPIEVEATPKLSPFLEKIRDTAIGKVEARLRELDALPGSEKTKAVDAEADILMKQKRMLERNSIPDDMMRAAIRKTETQLRRLDNQMAGKWKEGKPSAQKMKELEAKATAIDIGRKEMYAYLEAPELDLVEVGTPAELLEITKDQVLVGLVEAAREADQEEIELTDQDLAEAVELSPRETGVEAPIVALADRRAEAEFLKHRREHIEQTAIYMTLRAKNHAALTGDDMQRMREAFNYIFPEDRTKTFWGRYGAMLSESEREVVTEAINRRIRELRSKKTVDTRDQKTRQLAISEYIEDAAAQKLGLEEKLRRGDTLTDEETEFLKRGTPTTQKLRDLGAVSTQEHAGLATEIVLAMERMRPGLEQFYGREEPDVDATATAG